MPKGPARRTGRTPSGRENDERALSQAFFVSQKILSIWAM